MKKILLIGSLFLLLGAGCAPSQPSVSADATPGVNENNCVKSGGAVDGDSCACPEGFAPDPAGFCLDAQGKPGGEMAVPKSQ